MQPLNLFREAQRRNPYPIYWPMRRIRPLLNIPRYDVWMVYRYDDVKRVLTDYTNFSSDFRRLFRPGEASPRMRADLISSDPPVHTKLRNLVNRAFTSRAVANLEPRIRQLTHEMLDGVVETGRIDLVRDLAYPLPVIVIAEMLGIPPEDRARFKTWSDEIVRSADRVIVDRDAAGEHDDSDGPPDMAGTMRPYFQEIIARRRVEPRDDLISGLVAAEIDGERLTEQDVLSLCSLLLIAGNVTTTNLIGNAILTLLKHPEQLARLRADLSLLPGAIEEVLRYRSPVQFMFRVAAQDGELGGQKIRAGARVIAFIGSANRDEGKFAHANQFDITRSPNPHLAFGHGVHYCLGAPLARLEARVALTAILERLPNLARASKWPLPPTEALILNGVRQLPLRFTPGPRFAMA